MRKRHKNADICLILEGGYPYIPGGVSTWTYELIKAQNDLTFHLVCILPQHAKPKILYEIPQNVLNIQNVFLQEMPQGIRSLPKAQSQQLFTALETSLPKLQSQAHLKDLEKIINLLHPPKKQIGSRLLLNSEAAWDMLVRMYNKTMKEQAFLDYFWSWRALQGGLYSILLADLPETSCYHSFCTGYAGLMLARAKLETGKPCLLTEHNIYTHERLIETSFADWFGTPTPQHGHNLRNLWADSFTGYSKICYEACDQIITLFENNRELQIADGADPQKTRIIPNGINYGLYSNIPRFAKHPPSIALIGRIVPLKDIKTFIRSCAILRNTIPDLQAYVIGPMDEDKEYVRECLELTAQLQLHGTLTFTGKVNITDYLSTIDVVVLTSLNEGQPLSILEAGAAGIPAVATDVGGCSEIIMGSLLEDPKLGAGGGIATPSNPQSVAYEIAQLLTDKTHYEQCSNAIRERVRKYYNEAEQYKAYAVIYRALLELKKTWKETG